MLIVVEYSLISCNATGIFYGLIFNLGRRKWIDAATQSAGAVDPLAISTAQDPVHSKNANRCLRQPTDGPSTGETVPPVGRFHGNGTRPIS